MPMRPAVSAALLAILLAVPAASAQGQIGGRRCATPEPTVGQALELAQHVRAFQARTASLRADRAEPVTVPVAVHVVSEGPSPAQGNVPDAWIAAQVDTLNATYGRLGLRFALALVQRVENPAWYRDLELGSAQERAMKDALALDPARVLNLYTARPSGDYLGWATLPDAGAEADRGQGVVVLDQSLPGGTAAPYDLGHTTTHEVGHWAGLLHTFSGGCSAPGDGVDDTPQQRSGSSRCPTARDSCPLDPGLDPVHNYMDYSDDACMTEFTPGQGLRSRALLAQFRPTIVAGGYAVAAVPQAELAEALVGLDAATTLRVTNATDQPFAVTGVASDGLAVAAGGLPATVAPGEAVALALAVRPPAAGAFSETLAVTTTSPAAGVLTARLEGTAFLPPTARLGTPAVRARVQEGGDAERQVTLANDGDRPLSFAVDPEALPAGVAGVSPASGVVPPRGEVTLTFSLAAAGLAPDRYARPVVIGTNDPVGGAAVVTVDLQVLARPTALAVLPVYPNPTRGPVTVPLALPASAAVWAEVYDARGRRVAVVADGAEREGGYPEIAWDAGGVPAGVYLVRVWTPTEAAVARVVVTR